MRLTIYRLILYLHVSRLVYVLLSAVPNTFNLYRQVLNPSSPSWCAWPCSTFGSMFFFWLFVCVLAIVWFLAAFSVGHPQYWHSLISSFRGNFSHQILKYREDLMHGCLRMLSLNRDILRALRWLELPNCVVIAACQDLIIG